MRRLGLILILTAIAQPAFAQGTATGGNSLGWTQTGPDLATVSAYTYKHYDDASATGVAFTGVTCAASTTTPGAFDCQAPFPAFTPGSHSMAMTASNVAGESAKSSPLSFVFVVVPAVPTSLRIK
jgi:hypothetical protein